MKPTIGRIVIYRHHSGADCAALISAVRGTVAKDDTRGLVNLHVFPPDGSPVVPVTNISFSEKPKANTWSWPQREEPAK